MTVSNKVKIIWQEVAVAYCKVINQHLLAEPQVRHENTLILIVCVPARFEQGTPPPLASRSLYSVQGNNEMQTVGSAIIISSANRHGPPLYATCCVTCT